MKRILIAEDDLEIAELERDYLEMNGFASDIAPDGQQALEMGLNGDYALILLDIMLPRLDGYEVCKRLREKLDIPILMVTAKGESTDKIFGLGLGADDYIPKPFDPAELVARIKSHINRYERLKGPSASSAGKNDEIRIGDTLVIHPKNWKVFKNGQELRLPNREFEILVFLAQNPNKVFSREQLFERIWGIGYISDSATVTVHIGRIREKIEEDPQNPRIIETIWGAGYRLNLPEEK
ncbi:MAG: response regulator transcription factor [Clostridia bacterium]|nr:response regulator transcription factor [Clostridia bacterium]MBQ3092422.1 response regulator transcription factor [Clostridia bacterium]